MLAGVRPNSRKIGDIDVTTVSDGILNATLNNFVGITPAEAERMSGLPADGPVPLAVNAFLLTFNGKRALIDVGSSSTMGPTLGKLPDNLRAIGVAPETIDFVLLTHIHPDHSNGLVDEIGGANFPNADVIVNREDLRFWVDREPQASDNEFRQRNMAAARLRTLSRTRASGQRRRGLARHHGASATRAHRLADCVGRRRPSGLGGHCPRHRGAVCPTGRGIDL
jgi:glyoxylase-like metal-dependent hydrolase (beta-lactamase superfamily II)